MASIVDLYAQFGPIAYFPLQSTNQSRDAISGVTGTETNVGATIAGPLSDTVIDFNGTNSRIEIPNFSDRCNGYDALTFVAFSNVAAQPSALTRVMQIRDEVAGDTLTEFLQNAVSDSVRYYASASGAETIKFSSLTQLYAAWHCESGYLIVSDNDAVSHRLSTSGNVASLSSALDSISWGAGHSLFIGDDYASGAPFDGGFCHLAAFPRVLEKYEHDLIAAADSSGVWCAYDLGGVGKKITEGVPAVDETGSPANWTWRLTKDGPDGLLYSTGSDFSLTSGVPDRLEFLPATGSYFLMLYNPVSGAAHSDFVTMVAA